MTLPIDASTGDLAARVVLALSDRKQTVATAESLTGGLVGATITSAPGASVVYRGGLITYATELKAELAGVSPSVLEADGPVAGTTAAGLARGAARRCRADWGLATTGVAGPDPQDGHPVGLVFVAVAGERRTQVRELSLAGDRSEIRAQTVVAVLALLIEQLEASGAPAAG